MPVRIPPRAHYKKLPTIGVYRQTIAVPIAQVPFENVWSIDKLSRRGQMGEVGTREKREMPPFHYDFFRAGLLSHGHINFMSDHAIHTHLPSTLPRSAAR